MPTNRRSDGEPPQDLDSATSLPTNRTAADLLRRLAALLEARGENPYRVRAYEDAAAHLDELTPDLRELAAQGRVREIPARLCWPGTHSLARRD